MPVFESKCYYPCEINLGFQKKTPYAKFDTNEQC